MAYFYSFEYVGWIRYFIIYVICAFECIYIIDSISIILPPPEKNRPNYRYLIIYSDLFMKKSFTFVNNFDTFGVIQTIVYYL